MNVYKVKKFKNGVKVVFTSKKSFKSFMKAYKNRDWSKWHISNPVPIELKNSY